MGKFGRTGYVAKKDKSTGKMSEWGFLAIVVGYAENSATGMYLMYSLSNKRVILTLGVKWHGF